MALSVESVGWFFRLPRVSLARSMSKAVGDEKRRLDATEEKGWCGFAVEHVGEGNRAWGKAEQDVL